MNIPQSTQGQYPAPPVGALNSPAYAQAYSKYMSNNPNLGMQPNQFASRSEFMYGNGGPTVPYTKETSTAFSGNRGQGPLQAGFNNATPGEYPAISFARNRTTQNVDPRQWANLVVGDLKKPMGVTDTIESMSKNTGATSKRVPMDIYFKNGGNLPKANMGEALIGITDFLGSEQGGQLINTVGQLAPIVQGMVNKPQQGQRPMQTPQQGMMNPYGMPYTNNPYLPQFQQRQNPSYGGFTYGNLSGPQAEALGMPNYGRQFNYGGPLPTFNNGADISQEYLQQQPGAGTNAWDTTRETAAGMNPIIGAFHELGSAGTTQGQKMIDNNKDGTVKNQIGEALRQTADPMSNNLRILENKDLSGDQKASSILSQTLTGGWGGDDWFGLVKREKKENKIPTIKPTATPISSMYDGVPDLDGTGSSLQGFGPGRQFAYGGMLPKHGFGDFLTSAADAATETIGSGMKIMDPLNIGYGTALSRGMGNLVGEDRYQKGWDQFTDGTQAFVGGAAKGAVGVLPGQMGSLATKGMDAVSGIADNALNNNEYGQLYEGQDKLKQIAGGAGQIGGAIGGGILTGNVAGAVGSGMQGAGNVMQGIDMNNAGEQTGGGWQTAGNITNAASGLASFLPTGAYGGKLPSYGFGNQIGLPGYMGDKDREITINAMNRATPIQSMYNQTPQYQHGMGQSMRGFGPGNQMAYGEMFAKGGVLPSYHNGGEGPGHPHDTETVYSMMNNSEKLKGKPSYWYTRRSYNNNAEGITTMQNDLQQMDINRDEYLALEQAKKDLEIEQATLRDYYGQQNYSQTEGIPVDKVNELSPTYYDKMTAYQNMLKNNAGIENTNLAGNIEGNQIPYHDQAFGFRHNSYRPGLHAAENYTQSNANVTEYADINVDKGQQVYNKDGREKVYDNQNQLLRNEEIPTNRGLKSDAMMFYGNTGPIGVHMDEQGRKYLQGEDGSNLGYFGEDFAYGGNLPSYHNGGKGTGHPHDTISKSLTNKNLVDLKIPKYTKDPNYKYGFSKAESNNIMAGAGLGNNKIGAGLFGMTPSSSKDRKYFKGMVDANINYNVNPNLNLKLGMNDAIGRGFKPGFNAGVKYKFQDGGAMQGQHPQAQYEVEKDEMMYHPNDKPVSLANGGLNQVANNYSKVTGNKHSHPNGGPQMAGGEGGYVYSDQLKVPKDLYNSLKGLI